MTPTPNPTAERWRKKPVEIEAMQWDGSALAATPIIDWVLAGGGTASYYDPQPATSSKGRVVRKAVPALLVIRTLEGSMRAIPGDYIIRGVQGEFYPCKPDIFDQTYEPAGLRREEGAPSEEQILTALNAMYPRQTAPDLSYWGEKATEQMRAALKAVGVAPQEPSIIEGRCRACGNEAFEGTAEGVIDYLDAPSPDREKLIAKADLRISEWSVEGQRPSDIGLIMHLRDALAAQPVLDDLEPVILAAEVAWRGRGRREPLSKAIARDITAHLRGPA